MNKEILQNIIDQAKALNCEVEILSEVKSGKEATVYRVLLNKKLAALKVYKDPEQRSFQKNDQYLDGKHYKKASERKAVGKGNKFSKKLIFDNWVKREFYILEQLFESGASIPKPIMQIENAIFMEFLGDMETVAPRLCDIELSEKFAMEAFTTVLDTMLIFWDYGIVHADLSEFNVLWWKEEAFLIDFPQAIDKRTHPNPNEILERDLKNITKHFIKYFDIEYEKIRELFK